MNVEMDLEPDLELEKNRLKLQVVLRLVFHNSVIQGPSIQNF